MKIVCADAKQWIDRDLDGELDAPSRAALARHLESCAACADDSDNQRSFIAAVRTADRKALAPDELRAAIGVATAKSGAVRPSFARPLAAVAAVLAIAISVALGATWSTSTAHATALPELAFVHHKSVLAGNMPLDVTSSDPRQVVDWLKPRVRFGVELPHLDSADLSLVGARVFEARGALAAFVLYEKGHEPIGLAIAPSTDGAAPSRVHAVESETFKSIRFDFHEMEDQHVISWVDRGLEYALVSKLPAQGRESCQVCHMSGSGLPDTSDFHR